MKYAAPNTETGFNVDENPDVEPMQFKLTARQMSAVEIAMNHLDDIEDDNERAPVEYAVQVLLYDVRPTAEVLPLVSALKTHLRQAGVLTKDERVILLEIPEGA